MEAVGDQDESEHERRGWDGNHMSRARWGDMFMSIANITMHR